MSRDRVDIVMATYNGAQYIEEQLRSLCRQTYGDWRCLVHDDGSTDGTQDILRAWAAKEARIVFIEDGIHGLGPAKHFLYILKYSDAPWVMWADQDDIWFENKIEKMVACGEQAIAITELQIADSKRMTSSAFLAGRTLNIGDTFA